MADGRRARLLKAEDTAIRLLAQQIADAAGRIKRLGGKPPLFLAIPADIAAQAERLATASWMSVDALLLRRIEQSLASAQPASAKRRTDEPEAEPEAEDPIAPVRESVPMSDSDRREQLRQQAAEGMRKMLQMLHMLPVHAGIGAIKDEEPTPAAPPDI